MYSFWVYRFRILVYCLFSIKLFESISYTDIVDKKQRWGKNRLGDSIICLVFTKQGTLKFLSQVDWFLDWKQIDIQWNIYLLLMVTKLFLVFL